MHGDGLPLLPPEDQKPGQNEGSNASPEEDSRHHRLEAKAYIFLVLWIFSDFLVLFGHNSIAIWVFYFVFIIALGLFTHHATKGWPRRKRIWPWVYALSWVILPFILFALSRPAKVTERQAGIPELVKRLVAESITNLNKQESAIGLSDSQLQGNSFCLLVRLGTPIAGRDNYVFDMGENWEKNRISLYVDAEQNLCFRVIDQDAQPIVLRVKSALETFRFHDFVYLMCEYGSTNNFGFVRVAINGRQVAEKHQATPIIIAPLAEMVLVSGSDIYERNGCIFNQIAFFGYDKTINRAKDIEILNMMNANVSTAPPMTFNGSNSLKCVKTIRLADFPMSDTNITSLFGFATFRLTL